MKEIEKTITVYVADDGKEFTNKANCELYEKENKHTRWFRVMHTPDLNETGNLLCASYFVVYSDYWCYDAILDDYLRKELKYSKIGPSVMGYGLLEHYKIVNVDRSVIDNEIKMDFEVGKTKKIITILSPKKLDWIDYENCEYFNYMKAWDLK